MTGVEMTVHQICIEMTGVEMTVHQICIEMTTPNLYRNDYTKFVLKWKTPNLY